MHSLRLRGVAIVGCVVVLVAGIAGPGTVAANAASARQHTRATSVASNIRALSKWNHSGSSAALAGSALAPSPRSSPTTSAASAVTSSSDPSRDNGWGFDPRGDIRTYGVSDDGTTITAGLSTAVFDNPSLSYNWRAFQIGDPAWINPTDIVFSLDVDNDFTSEYDVYFVWTSSGVLSDVTPYDQPSKILCAATPHWDAGTATYSSDIPASCLGRPAAIRGTAYLHYETASTVSGDETGFTAAVSPNGTPPPPPPPSPCSAHQGYWLLGRDGGVFSFGPNARFYGSTAALRLNQPVVGIASAKNASGYWLVAADGGIFNFGPGAHFYGSTGAMHLNQPVVGMAARPQADGYWLVASNGAVFSYGNAKFFGSAGAMHLNQPIVGMATTPTGDGYWLVARDGGIFSYGDATFYGSTGAIRLNEPIVGMTSMPNGHGYWLVARDGGIFSYGPNSRFHGAGGETSPIVGMHSAIIDGYRIAASDGGVFGFGAPDCGSMSGRHLSAPIVAIETAGSPV